MISDTSDAKQLVKEVRGLKKRSRLDEWFYHWVAAHNYAAHNDYQRASAEAKAAIAMAPYDTLSHANLSRIVSAAGDHEAAIAWAKFAATHDPHPKNWYFDNLIDAYDMADKWPDALKLAEGQLGGAAPNKNWYKVLARAYAGTNQPDKAKEAREKFETLPYSRSKSGRRGKSVSCAASTTPSERRCCGSAPHDAAGGAAPMLQPNTISNAPTITTTIKALPTVWCPLI